MRYLEKDNCGKEAFAYLSIILLVLSSFFISYMAYYQNFSEEMEQHSFMTDRLSMELNDISLEIRSVVEEAHDDIFMNVHRMIMNENGSRSDLIMEKELNEILLERINVILRDRDSVFSNCNFSIQDIVIDVTPLPIYHEIPVVGNNKGTIDSGRCDTCEFPGSGGVNTTIMVIIVGLDVEKKLRSVKTIRSSIIRESEMDVFRSRLKLFNDSLSGTELVELYQHILTTLANSKAYLGSGRDTVIPGASGPILSRNEISSCFDLSVNLLAWEYFGSYDIDLMELLESNLESERGSIDCSPSIIQMLEEHDGPFDAGMLVQNIEGLFSEECPPSAEDVLRPIILSVAERLVIGLVDYIGIEPDTLSAFSGVHDFYRKIDEEFEKFAETLSGREIISSGERAARDLISKLYRLDPGLDEYNGITLIRSLEGYEYNGTTISSYPFIDPLSFDHTITVDLMNGSKISRYLLNLTIDPGMSELSFKKVQLKENERTVNNLMSIIGLDKRNIEAEVILKEHCENALRSAIDEFLNQISNGAGDIWNETWNGWTSEDYPSLCTSIDPTRFLSNSTFPGFEPILNLFFDLIHDKLDLVDYDDLHLSLMSSISDSFSDLMYDEFYQIVKKDMQIEYARCEYLMEVEENIGVDLASLEYLVDPEVGIDIVYDGKGVALSIEDFQMDPTLIVNHLLNETRWGTISPSLEERLVPEIERGLEEMRMREWAYHNHTNGPGFLRKAMINEITRGGDGASQKNLVEKLESLKDWMDQTIVKMRKGISNDISLNRELTASRYFLPEMNNEGFGYRNSTGDRNLHMLRGIVNIDTIEMDDPEIRCVSGRFNPDPASNSSRYSTDFNIHCSKIVNIRINGMENSTSRSKLLISVNSSVTTYTIWPMQGTEYETGETLLDIAKEKGKEELKVIVGHLMNLSSRLLPDTLGSLKQIFPLILNIIDEGDLDLTQIMKVLTNISLDLSTSLRKAVKEIIGNLIEMGLSWALSELLDLLGLDRLQYDFNTGPLELSMSIVKDALFGGEGDLLLLEYIHKGIGLTGSMRINRTGNHSVKFNGTSLISFGDLDLRIELDPFMELRPHLISIDGIVSRSEGRKKRLSIGIPTLKEYRSTEVSLSGSLGVEPMIPIPPLGIQAVIDAGFRIDYRMPDELPPVINEVFFENSTLSAIEIFNPRRIPITGSTLEIHDTDGILIRSWKLEGPPNRYSYFLINETNVWNDGGETSWDTDMTLVLRSPSGLIMDDVKINKIEGNALSRDKDGFGVWRWGDGTPGDQNSKGKISDIRTLIISLVVSSIKEAWSLAYDLYGISFETVSYFVQNAVDIFMERFLSMVAEIVIDVRLFLQIEVEDATGSAGTGLELSLRAEGEAVAVFMEWIYNNIQIILNNLRDPNKSGELHDLPYYLLEKCWISLLVYNEIETPVQIEKVASPDAVIPDNLMIGYRGSVNLAMPAKLMGYDIGGWSIELGLAVLEAPHGVVSIFYDITDFSHKSELWLVHAVIREETIQIY